MRSDAKLGLALAMLVIGFAIAFCFPRDGRLSWNEPVNQTLSPSQESEIEFVPIRTLRQRQQHQTESVPLTQLQTPGESKAEAINPEVLPTIMTKGRASQNPHDSQEFSVSTFSSETGLQNLLKTLLDENADERTLKQVPPEQHSPASGATAPKSTSSLQEFQTYEVQPGDTLSAISLKTLGSYSRYLEIFAANQDKLNSPDDLRTGLRLRIPKPSANPQPATLDSPESGEVLPQEVREHPLAEKDERRFQTPHSAPFLSDRGQSLPVQQIPAQQLTNHVVRSGETLEGIAIRYFGSPQAIDLLKRANPEIARHPHLLKPGTILRLQP